MKILFSACKCENTKKNTSSEQNEEGIVKKSSFCVVKIHADAVFSEIALHTRGVACLITEKKLKNLPYYFRLLMSNGKKAKATKTITDN